MTTRRFRIVLILSALALGATGCKERSAPAGPDSGPAGPSRHSLQSKLVGAWRGDFEWMRSEDPEIQRMPPDQQATLKAAYEKMTFRFEPGTIALTDPEGRTEQGTWKVRSEQGARLVIETTEAGGKGATVTKILAWTGEDRIEISRPGKPDRIYLRRKK